MNEIRHTRELEKKRSFEPLLMSLQLQITISLSLSLTHTHTHTCIWTELWIRNRDTTSQYNLTKNLNPKNKEKKLKLISSPFCPFECSIYKEKPSGGERTKIGRGNAPPTVSTKPQKCGFGRVFVARWPHSGDTAPGFDDFPSSSSGFPVSAPEFGETVFNLWL